MQKINTNQIDKLPLKYKECLNYIKKISKQIYKDNLIAIFLAGSGGKNNIIDGWSDIDLYFITKSFDMNSNYELYSKVKDNKFGIHVGTTFYTEDMIKNLKVDSKTLVAFYEYINLNTNYFIYNNVEIPKINFKNIIYNNREIVDLVQVVSRELNCYILNKNNFKILIKKITLLIKVYLIKKYNKIIYGYNNVFNEINNINNIKNNINIDNIIKKGKLYDSEIKYFSDIIKLIIEGI